MVMEGEADDESGHRTYRIVFRVLSDDKFDGPAAVMQTPGLPLPGSLWAFGNDLDVYAWCRPGMRVRKAPGVKPGPVRHWDVERTFSTKVAAPSGGTSSGRPGSSGPGKGGNRQGCHDGRVEDPLLEPMGVSGSFIKRIAVADFDRHGNAILTSSWEKLLGSASEWEESNPTVTVEQNVPNLQLDLCTSMLDTLNDAPLWGLPARTWRLVNFDWERKYHGLCYPYYVRRFSLEANYKLVTDEFTGAVVLQPAWDRVIDDAGVMALRGSWGAADNVGTGTLNETGWELETIGGVLPNPSKPGDFTRYRDREGNFANTVLNGMGIPYDPDDALRSFHWVYIVALTPNATSGTYNSAQALSDNDQDETGVADVYGPFYTAEQALAASVDAELFTSSRYRGWSGPDAYPKPGRIRVEKFGESNLLLLGLPVIL